MLQLSGALTAGSLLAACSPSSGSKGSSANAGKLLGPADAPYATIYPKLPKGGSMVMGLLGSSASGLVSLDLLTSTVTASIWAAGPVHDYLEVYDDNSQLKPSLAQTVTQVNPTTVRYKLRSNLFFHNGQPITAQDVKDTLDYCMAAANRSLWLSQLAGVTVAVTDPLTVTLTTAQPSATLRSTLAQLPIIPISTAGKQATAPVGAGPFVFQQWVQDSYLSFTKFDKYWNPDAPRVDTLKINLVPDANAGLQSLQARQMECIFPASVASLALLKTMSQAGQATIYTTPAAMQLGMNNTVKPFDDPNVRKAVRLAIDKATVVQDVYLGFSQPLVSIGVPVDDYYYPADLAFTQDLATAKQLISTAGATGTTVNLLCPNSDAYPATAAIVQQNLNAIGLNVKIETTDFATVVSRMFTSHSYEIGLVALSMEEDPAGHIDRYLLSTGASNFSRYSNPQVDALLKQGHVELDTVKRKAIYDQALKIALIDESAIAPICTDIHIAVAQGKNPNLSHYGPWPNNMYHWPILVNKA
ncbi:MAG TPA: ABC transporter substrate-binding protein [Jatrophihabitans sp.]|jgi:peptide/nickel transport system substrate-binding protein